ncbi:hypothetical protein [Marinospirillum sp.]|uniref:hypothetical protein n=1 Tax=Marinospirillum sp. TaxID=2183934 RepID=UPI00384D5F9E
MKKLLTTLAFVLTFGLFSSAGVLAQEDNDSMNVVDETSEPDDIELPEDAAPEAQENAQQDLDTANEAREKGREFGQERAQEARSRAEEARQRGQEARNRGEQRHNQDMDSPQQPSTEQQDRNPR